MLDGSNRLVEQGGLGYGRELEEFGRQQLQDSRFAGWVVPAGVTVAVAVAVAALFGVYAVEEEEQLVDHGLDGSFPFGEFQQCQSVGCPAFFAECRRQPSPWSGFATFLQSFHLVV